MDCREAQNITEAWFEGKETPLSADKALEFNKHRTQCASCRMYAFDLVMLEIDCMIDDFDTEL